MREKKPRTPLNVEGLPGGLRQSFPVPGTTSQRGVTIISKPGKVYPGTGDEDPKYPYPGEFLMGH